MQISELAQQASVSVHALHAAHDVLHGRAGFLHMPHAAVHGRHAALDQAHDVAGHGLLHHVRKQLAVAVQALDDVID